MPIVSSAVSYSTQADSRRWVTEQHTNHAGRVLTRSYLAAAAYVADLAASAAALAASERETEIEGNIARVRTEGRLAAPLSLEESTAAQNASALREAYRNGTRTEAIMIGDFLDSLTDTQLRNAFGLTAAQVTNLRTNKLAPAASAAATIRAATGA